MADEVEEVVEEGGKEKSSLMPIVVILAIVILAELAFVFYIISSVKGAEAPTKEEEVSTNVVPEDSTLIAIAYSAPIQILVNVKGTDGDRYFKAEFVIDYDEGRYPLLGEYLGSQMPRFKDVAIQIFSNQDMNVLDNAKIREKYSDQLKADIAKFIPSDKVMIKNILTNEWLIQ